MDEFKNEFRGGYDDGRSDFAREVENVREGNDISSDYYFKIAKNGCFPGIVIFIVIVFFLWRFLKVNFFLSLVDGYILAMVIFVLWALSLVSVIRMKGRMAR